MKPEDAVEKVGQKKKKVYDEYDDGEGDRSDDDCDDDNDSDYEL